MSKVSIVIYSEEDDSASAIARVVEQTTHGEVAAVARHEIDLKEALGEQRPDVILADLGADPHRTLGSLEQVELGDIPIFVAGPQNDNALLLRALKLGVKEFFAGAPSVPELDGAIEEILLARLAEDRSSGRAPILAVMGAKGGVGATLVACQVAASLNRLGGRAAVVDLNCPLGDVALQLDLQPRYTLASVLSQDEQFDVTFLESLLERHASGLQILAAPERVEENELVRGSHVEKVLTLLRNQVDWIVVDVARSWNEASVRALDLASEILLVTSPDLAALAHTRQHVDLLKRLGHADAKIHLVANRHSGSDAVTRQDFEKFVGRPFDVTLPNDYAHAVEAVNGGRTLGDFAPRSALTLAFDQLAREAHGWCEVPLDQPDASKAGFGSRVRRLLGR